MMNSKTLSAVLEKLIHRLGLNNFPCGNGSWRESKDRPEGPVTLTTDELLDLLNCPRSPWWQNNEWSPQASSLRQLAVLTPERLNPNFIYSYFTTLRILDKGVSVIDNGLLKFSKLEELVLSANLISEINGENLPRTLKTLELRANRLSSLKGFISCQLQYLSLASNSLGSNEDVFYLTGNYWPQLVGLDLSDCDFQDQQALLKALSTLPCLKTLLLEGNPLTLAPGYRGFTVDTVPQLVCLDTSWISPEERDNFKGLSKMSDVIVDKSSATVMVGRMRGIPDPLMSEDDKASDFPVVTYGYIVTYKFFGHHTTDDMKPDNSESKLDTESTAHVTEDGSSDTDLQSNKNGGRETSTPDTEVFNADETCFDTVHLPLDVTQVPLMSEHPVVNVSQHSTSKLPWSECMDFGDTQTYVVSGLGDFRKFLNQGLYLRLEEEKVLSWPAVSKDAPVAKPSQAEKEKKGGKGKEAKEEQDNLSCYQSTVQKPVKSASTKDKTKDKKRKSVVELIQDTPIRRVLGSAHVPLHSLVKGSQKVNVLCDFWPEMEASQTFEKDLDRKRKEDKKKDDKEPKQRGGSGAAQKNTATSKGSKKGSKQKDVDINEDNFVPVQLEPVTVELSVELEKWQSTSEAHLLVLPHQNS